MPNSTRVRRRPARVVLISLFAGVLGAVLSVGAPTAASKDEVSVSAVHRAIASGAAYLRQTYAAGFEGRTYHDPVELVVLTLHHAGANFTDAIYKGALEVLETTPLAYTYRVSVLAMALAEVDHLKYRARLAHCAQWLVDTQLPGGEWGYPGVVEGRKRQPSAVSIPPPPAPEEGAEGIEITRRTDPETQAGQKGDFSNTQFAILGLRACRDAGVGIPKETWDLALAYNLRTQRRDGGWGYDRGGLPDEASYASLTCAGVCGTAICLHALGKPPDSHAGVKRARKWLDKYFDPNRNFGLDRSAVLGPSSWQCYHLYSVERVGSVLGWKKIRSKPWYPAGAKYLLRTQRADGSWVDAVGGQFGEQRGYLTAADTCFAILFLARATPPLTGR